jgi:hypothetical protein
VRRLALLLTLAAGLATPAAAQAAPSLSKVGDFASPTYVTSPPGDARLFVVEQAGRVKVISGGATKTFLDVSAITNTSGNERGLLSIAFPPDYAASGLSYVFLTGAGGALQVYEHRASGDPDAADPASRRLVISIPHTEAANHNGGQLQFGPDGLLYVGTGDGGNSNDTPTADAEVTSSPLGKILRIDPRGAVDGAHTVPADNPFGNAVWAYGLRNPWRFSFDRATGDLAIADVGQNHREEIDFAPAAAGRGRGVNYGWRCWEGSIRTTASTTAPEGSTPLCSDGQLPANPTFPVIDFTHSGQGFCSITGGYVVRDPGLPTLAGRYLYSDFCNGRLRSLALPDAASDRDEGVAIASPTSFGEDACGRLYVASRDGAVSRIVDGAATPCAPAAPGGGGGGGTGGGGAGTPGAPGGGAADTTKPRLRIRVTGVRTLAPRRRLRIAVTSNELATVRAGGRLRGIGRLRTARRQLQAGRRTVLTVKISRQTARRLRRTLHRKRAIAALTILARDAAGNQRRAERRVKVERRPRGPGSIAGVRPGAETRRDVD